MKKSISIWLSLTALLVFVACSSSQTNKLAQTSTAATIPSPTSAVAVTTQPTSTVVPTNTPLPPPVNTSTPLATDTPQPTSTPTLPVEQAWSFSPNNILPKIDDGNANFEQLPDGTGTLRFADENDLLYYIELKPPTDLINRRGDIINGELAVILSRSSPDPTFVPPLPKIIVQDSTGDKIAWFDLDSGQWYKRYETIFTKSLEDYDQNLNHPWIGNDLGLEFFSETASPYLMGYSLFLSGQVTRIWTEQYVREAGEILLESDPMKWEGGLGKITWIDLTYDLEGNTVEILVNSDLEHEYAQLFLRHRSQFLVISNGQASYEAVRSGIFSYRGPRDIPAPDIVYSNQEILDALQKSDFLLIELGLSYEDTDVFPTAYLGDTVYDIGSYFLPDPLMRLYYLQAHNSDKQKGFLKHLVNPYLSSSNQLQSFDAYLGDVEPIADPVPFGYFQMWIIDSERSVNN